MIRSKKLLAAAAAVIAIIATGLLSTSPAEARHWRDGYWRHGWGGGYWRSGFYPAVYPRPVFYPRPLFVPPPPLYVVRPAAYVLPPPPVAYGYGYGYGRDQGYRYSYRKPVKKRYYKKVRQQRPCVCPERPAAAPAAPEK